MKAILVVMSYSLSTSAFADATCDATAKDKKLRGAALDKLHEEMRKGRDGEVRGRCQGEEPIRRSGN